MHLPKPLHGWREFAGEVGIIVVGVLVALAAQQLVEDLHHRSDALEARESIQAELEINMARLASRTAQRQCVEHRLAEVQGLLDRGAGGALVVPPHWVGRPQFWTMQTVRWDAISQAGRAALLPPKELADYGLMYTIMRNITGVMTSEQADLGAVAVARTSASADAGDGVRAQQHVAGCAVPELADPGLDRPGETG
jgi:hypothetical protein